MMFSLMSDMNEKAREWGDREKGQKVVEKTEEAACSEASIKFNIDSVCPKFLHLSMHLSLLVT